MPALRYDLNRIQPLVERPQGVTNAELQDLFHCVAADMVNVLARGQRLRGWVRGRSPQSRGRFHYFATAQLLNAWLAAEHVAAPRLLQPLPADTSAVVSEAAPDAAPEAPPDAAPAPYSAQLPAPGRINRMADPLPTVPGWGRVVYREGAFDYRRHQCHGPAATLPTYPAANSTSRTEFA